MVASYTCHTNFYRNVYALVPDRSVTGLVLPLCVGVVLGVVCTADTHGRADWLPLGPWLAWHRLPGLPPRDQGVVRLEQSQHGGLCCGSRSGCGMMDPELGEGFVCRTGFLGTTLCVLATLPGRYWCVAGLESLLPRTT